jgi:hypothetical protein
LQLGADVPAGMIPIPDIKFSGFTGSNPSDSIMTLNGNIKGLPNTSDAYLPFRAIFQGDPFNTNGKYLSDGVVVDTISLGVYELSIEQGYVDTYTGIDATKSFNNGNYYFTDANNNDKVKWQLGLDGSITHDGSYNNDGYVVYQGGGSDTIPDNVSFYVYDPATTQSGASIYLPANPSTAASTSFPSGISS